MTANRITAHEVIILILAASEKHLNGRTVLQKLGYFWSVYVSDIDEVKFEPHYYGPYSAKLRQAIDEMVGYGLLNVTVHGDPVNDRHHYTLSADGRGLVKDLKNQYGAYYAEIQKVIEKCVKLRSFQPNLLSHAAKVTYKSMLKELDAEPEDDLMLMSVKLDWNMTKSQAKSGEKLYNEIKTIFPIKAYC
ncbi:hypothetical protein CENSYa_2033 [Cenarchaeum symbiosum A]|uniref:Uncharacterized protein n=1 Tax=Cenarchaeum symbiosum (strain A) TaxID=414004 RepID=A0RZ69_CENSY|nr:hypothetical protein CENSYa_2033 [Cenarchaeum symbiosum A]